jgi:hypothetical protein
MFASKTVSGLCCALLVLLPLGLLAAQESTPAPHPRNKVAPTAPAASGGKRILLDDLVNSIVQQEQRLTDVMKGFKPVIETYIQETGSQPRFQKGVTPNGDDYFLGRLNLTGKSPALVPFADEQTWNQGAEKLFVQEQQPFNPIAFAQALFPDFDHFDRQNYTFDFVRWETLGAVRCAAVDVHPRGNSKNRGFVGRIWVEDHDYGIVRFRGTFIAKGLARRAFHFDSWRLNTHGNWWMPAYVYTEESDPHDPSAHKVWFKAQTRVWGYDLQNAADRREHSALLADNASWVDPNLQSAAYTVDETTPPENIVVERAQIAGLIAPTGDVDRILKTVVDNLQITNNLDIPGIRCRVLLTSPLESFVIGRTIVLSRGLLDVLPDEATLAVVLAHELAHVVLGHSVSSSEYLSGFALPFPDSQILASLDFHFDRDQETAADKKAAELLSKSPYKEQFASASLFLKAFDANSGRFPILLHGRFSNDFGRNHLVVTPAPAGAPRLSKVDRLDQISALPIGSRIVIDPWSDRIEMLKSKPVHLMSKAEKIPFEVAPFYPHLKRLDLPEKPQDGTQP